MIYANINFFAVSVVKDDDLWKIFTFVVIKTSVGKIRKKNNVA